MKHLQFQGRIALSDAQRLVVMYMPQIDCEVASLDDIPEFLHHVDLGAVAVLEGLHDPAGARRDVLTAAQERPDVVSMLAEAGAPTRMIDDVAAFGDLIADCDPPLLLDRCAADDSRGGFHIAYFQPESGIGVDDGDAFYGGVMLHGNSGNGRLRVAPRIVRQICTNGMTQTTDQVGKSCAYWRDADGRVRGEMGLALEAGLTREAIGGVVKRLAALTEIPAPEPIEALARQGVRVPPGAQERVRRVFVRDGDESLYGALNALTETARDAPTVAERIRLESEAGHSVLVKRPVPAKFHHAPLHARRV